MLSSFLLHVKSYCFQEALGMKTAKVWPLGQQGNLGDSFLFPLTSRKTISIPRSLSSY